MNTRSDSFLTYLRNKNSISVCSTTTKLIAVFILSAMSAYGGPNLLHSTDKHFFATQKATQIGETVLAYQRDTGGWPKNIDMSEPLDDESMQSVIADKIKTDDSTIDNGATTTQISYLAKLFNATGDERFADGFRRGVDFLLATQYDNGGFPQFFPNPRGYQTHITYNDNAMVAVLRLLHDIAKRKEPYDNSVLCDITLRERCKAAFDKGIDCIIATQIITDGKPAVWCQQHDRETFVPAGARAYELPSYCSQESAAITALLMDIENPDNRITNAVNGAMLWLENNKITGKRLMRDSGPKEKWNTRLEDDSTAAPIWARYYDLDSCLPFVCDRDGIARRSLEEIGLERRNGYSWYNNWASYLYPMYEAWSDLHCPENKTKLDYSSCPVAFPGAEGYGRFASGGRGGKVYHVSSLEDTGKPGTLRHAISAKGARTIIFDVTGTIFLNRPLDINEGNLTIAGQTSPGEGICLAGEPVNICADNVIIRYIRIRVGNTCQGEPDGLQCTTSRNVIIDHCTISWSVDECCSVYGNENTTVQWCLISESLRNAGHSKGSHGYGAIWGGCRASFHHNLLAHHDSRTPRLGPHPSTQTREIVDMRCNVIYNWSGNGCYGAEGMKANIVNNYFKPGPATPKEGAIRRRIVSPGVRTTSYCTGRDGQSNRWKPMEHIWGKYFIEGNVIEGDSTTSADNWSNGVYAQIRTDACDGTFTDSVKNAIKANAAICACNTSTESAEDAFRLVLESAGCSKSRDALDRRIINEVMTGTASRTGSISADSHRKPGIIDTPEDSAADGNNPLPTLSELGQKARTDYDGDGIPDDYETANGLNPKDPTDGTKIRTGNGFYTNLEIYLNSLVTSCAKQTEQP